MLRAVAELLTIEELGRLQDDLEGELQAGPKAPVGSSGLVDILKAGALGGGEGTHGMRVERRRPRMRWRRRPRRSDCNSPMRRFGYLLMAVVASDSAASWNDSTCSA